MKRKSRIVVVVLGRIGKTMLRVLELKETSGVTVLLKRGSVAKEIKWAGGLRLVRF